MQGFNRINITPHVNNVWCTGTRYTGTTYRLPHIHVANLIHLEFLYLFWFSAILLMCDVIISQQTTQMRWLPQLKMDFTAPATICIMMVAFFLAFIFHHYFSVFNRDRQWNFSSTKIQLLSCIQAISDNRNYIRFFLCGICPSWHLHAPQSHKKQLHFSTKRNRTIKNTDNAPIAERLPLHVCYIYTIVAWSLWYVSRVVLINKK